MSQLFRTSVVFFMGSSSDLHRCLSPGLRLAKLDLNIGCVNLFPAKDLTLEGRVGWALPNLSESMAWIQTAVGFKGRSNPWIRSFFLRA